MAKDLRGWANMPSRIAICVPVWSVNYRALLFQRSRNFRLSAAYASAQRSHRSSRARRLRKRGALVVYGVTAAAVAGAYSFESRIFLTAALTLGVFGVASIPPLLGAFNTELFPTHIRAAATAWANNGIGRIAYVLSPLAVGLAAESIGWGAAVRATAVFPLLALVLIAVGLPETAGRELEETSALPVPR